MLVFPCLKACFEETEIRLGSMLLRSNVGFLSVGPVFIYDIVLVLTRAIVCREVGDSLFRFLIELKFLRHLLPRCEEG